MKKIRVSESELIDLIEKLVKENIGGNTGFGSMLGTPTSKYKDLYEDEDVENEEELEEDEVNVDSAQTGDKTVDDEDDEDYDYRVKGKTPDSDYYSWMGKENKNAKSQLVRRISKKLHESEGKGCAESEGGSGCIKKRGDGWVILNNKKGGVWRKCTSEKDCQKQLDAFHANN